MFQTNQGPSFPAHQYLFGGTSAANAASDAAGLFASENMANSDISGLTAIAGCIAAASTTVQLIDAYGVENPANKMWPCFDHLTLPDLLPPSVTWRYYAPGAGSIWTAPNAIRHICQSSGPGGQCLGQAWSRNVDLKPVDVLTDIASCNLRSLIRSCQLQRWRWALLGSFHRQRHRQQQHLRRWYRLLEEHCDPHHLG